MSCLTRFHVASIYLVCCVGVFLTCFRCASMRHVFILRLSVVFLLHFLTFEYAFTLHLGMFLRCIDVVWPVSVLHRCLFVAFSFCICLFTMVSGFCLCFWDVLILHLCLCFHSACVVWHILILHLCSFLTCFHSKRLHLDMFSRYTHVSWPVVILHQCCLWWFL